MLKEGESCLGKGAASLPNMFWETNLSSRGRGRKAAVGNDPSQEHGISPAACGVLRGGQPVPLGSVVLCWDTVASHGALSSLVPAAGKEVTALRVFPKLKPVVPLPSPRPVASTMVDPGEAGVECLEGHLHVEALSGLPSVVLCAGGWAGSAEPLL